MAAEASATLIIERPVTDGLGSPAALVIVDEQVVGRLPKGRPVTFPVPPGDRWVVVWPANVWGKTVDPNCLIAQILDNPPATIRLRIETGGRAMLRCESNQPRLHPLVWYAGVVFIFCAVLNALGRKLSVVQAAQEILNVPLLVILFTALVFGPVGLVIWFRRAWRVGAFRHTVVSLTLLGGEGVSALPPESPITGGPPAPRTLQSGQETLT